jgi:single-strand DNA-binding protein
MKTLNKVTLIGNLGKDPEVQILEKDIKVAKFSLATTESYRDESGQMQTNTDWHNIVLWRGLADIVDKYCKKGSYVYVEGKLKTRTYTDKDGNKRSATEVIADQIILLDKKSNTDHAK